MGASGVITRVEEHPDNLPTDENHAVFVWQSPAGSVHFSASQKGLAMSCHFATSYPGLVRQAITEFCTYVFTNYPWCKMILAQVSRGSVMRLLPKLKFIHIADCSAGRIYARYNSEFY